MRFDPATLARLRRAMMNRGRTLSELLSEVLAGKVPPAFSAKGLDLKPGLRPEEALRRALDQLERRRGLLDADDDAYGRCDTCAADLGLVALTELPWADRCEAHRDE
jgi:hypothetical protein